MGSVQTNGSIQEYYDLSVGIYNSLVGKECLTKEEKEQIQNAIRIFTVIENIVLKEKLGEITNSVSTDFREAIASANSSIDLKIEQTEQRKKEIKAKISIENNKITEFSNNLEKGTSKQQKQTSFALDKHLNKLNEYKELIKKIEQLFSAYNALKIRNDNLLREFNNDPSEYVTKIASEHILDSQTSLQNFWQESLKSIEELGAMDGIASFILDQPGYGDKKIINNGVVNRDLLDLVVDYLLDNNSITLNAIKNIEEKENEYERINNSYLTLIELLNYVKFGGFDADVSTVQSERKKLEQPSVSDDKRKFNFFNRNNINVITPDISKSKQIIKNVCSLFVSKINQYGKYSMLYRDDDFKDLLGVNYEDIYYSNTYGRNETNKLITLITGTSAEKIFDNFANRVSNDEQEVIEILESEIRHYSRALERKQSEIDYEKSKLPKGYDLTMKDISRIRRYYKGSNREALGYVKYLRTLLNLKVLDEFSKSVNKEIDLSKIQEYDFRNVNNAMFDIMSEDIYQPSDVRFIK